MNRDYHMQGFPNCSWAQFEVCNDNQTASFEDLATELFYREFLKEGSVPHANHNNPGVEVDPELEPPRNDGMPSRRVSFQAKYFKGNIKWTDFMESAKQTVKHYGGQIDHVYIFCNKIISKGSSGYKKIEKLLEQQNITIQPVSDKDILNLLTKYKDVAERFFLQRIPCYDYSGRLPENGIIISHAEDVGESPSTSSEALTEELLSEKVEKCRQLLFSLQLTALSKEIHSIFSFKIEHIKSAGWLKFYKCLIELHDNGASDQAVPENVQQEVEWLQRFYKDPFPVTASEFSVHIPEIQLMIIDKLFSSNLWNVIVLIFDAKLELDKAVREQLEFYTGLSLFNSQDYEQAKMLFCNLSSRGDEKYTFFTLVAEIQEINSCLRQPKKHSFGDLDKQIKQLPNYSHSIYYKQNESLVALICLEGYYHLGLLQKQYLDDAITLYESFSDATKENRYVRYQLGLCYEIKGDYSAARIIYSSLNWKNEEIISQRYLISLIEDGAIDEAIESYNEIEKKTSRVVGVYLLALSRKNDDGYLDKLKVEIDEHASSLESLFPIAFYIENESTFEDYIIPSFSLLFENNYQTTPIQIRAGYIFLLARWRQIELLNLALIKDKDIDLTDPFITNEIYHAAFEAVNINRLANDDLNWRDPNAEAASQIADRYLELCISEKQFLQIKIMYCGLMNMKLSMLKYSKQYFELTQEERTALNVIALLWERNITDSKEYAPYVEALKPSTKPEYCLAVASALHRQGKPEEADYYAYKALYYLDEKDDFEIYKRFFGYINLNSNRYGEQLSRKTVSGNMVVTLEPVNTTGEAVVICLDSEDEFCNPNNRSMGIPHYNKNDSVYTKLIGSGIGQILKINNEQYKVKSFQSRASFAGSYVFSKVAQYPSEFGDSIRVLNETDPEKLVEQIKKYADRSEEEQELLNAYNREDGGIGLPIEAFISGDYTRYGTVIRTLLFTKDLAFQGGFPNTAVSDEKSFVPTLSTMVLAAALDCMSVLEYFAGRITIPVSYRAFIQEQYSRAVEKRKVSPGTFAVKDNQLILYESDNKNIEIWELLLDFCDNVNRAEITDEERINFVLLEGMTYEQVFAKMQFDYIQLDALILSKKLDSVYLCDDYFFRQLAEVAKLQTCNFASLLFKMDRQMRSSIIVKLSKTNYIHTPFVLASEDDGEQIYENLMNGRLKKSHYSAIYDAFYSALGQMIKEWQGSR